MAQHLELRIVHAFRPHKSNRLFFSKFRSPRASFGTLAHQQHGITRHWTSGRSQSGPTSTRRSGRHLATNISCLQQSRPFFSRSVWQQAEQNGVNTPQTPEEEEATKAKSLSEPRPVDGTKSPGRKVRQGISSLTTSREDIYTIPNILTVSRLIATPMIGYLVLHDQHVWAVGLFAYAGISDLIDGWVARKWKLQTVVGSVIDPMADKFLMAVLVGCLAIKGALPVWLATVIFGRDMALGIAAFYYRYASLPAPKTFLRYWDFSLPSAEVHPTTVSKWNTFLQLGLIGTTVVTPLLITSSLASGLLAPSNVAMGLQGFQYLVASTTIWSGASYLWTKDAVVILGQDEALKKRQGFRGRVIIGVSFAAFLALALRFASHKEGAVATSDMLAADS